MNSEERGVDICRALIMAGCAERVEVVKVKKEGDPLALLRAKSIPEFAFFLWEKHQRKTMSQLAICLPKGKCSPKFSVVCACCPSEIYGLEFPEKENKKWEIDKMEQFQEALDIACTENGIENIFLRHADVWNFRYRPAKASIKEVCKSFDFIGEVYPSEVIKQAFSFIDTERSVVIGNLRYLI